MTTRLKNKLSMAREEVLNAYRNGATLRQIGDLHGVSAGTVRNVLIEMGETLRARGRRKQEIAPDPRILATPNSGGGKASINGSSEYEGGSF